MLDSEIRQTQTSFKTFCARKIDKQTSLLLTMRLMLQVFLLPVDQEVQVLIYVDALSYILKCGSTIWSKFKFGIYIFSLLPVTQKLQVLIVQVLIYLQQYDIWKLCSYFYYNLMTMKCLNIHDPTLSIILLIQFMCRLLKLLKNGRVFCNSKFWKWVKC